MTNYMEASDWGALLRGWGKAPPPPWALYPMCTFDSIMPKVVKHLHMYFYALIILCPIKNVQRHSIRMMEQMEPGTGADVIQTFHEKYDIACNDVSETIYDCS